MIAQGWFDRHFIVAPLAVDGHTPPGAPPPRPRRPACPSCEAGRHREDRTQHGTRLVCVTCGRFFGYVRRAAEVTT